MTTSKTAIETYKYFSTLEGNQHIASEFALKIILKNVKKYKSKNILELGLGIGSISYAVLKFCNSTNHRVNYVGTEANEFCLNALQKYLKEYYLQLTVFKDLDYVTNSDKFDLIIIDGKDESLTKVKDIIAKRGIIIIEGDRIPQLNVIRSIFPTSLYTRIISITKNPIYGPFPSTSLCGGLQLIFSYPSFIQRLDYFYYRIETAIKYKIRRLLKQ